MRRSARAQGERERITVCPPARVPGTAYAYAARDRGFLTRHAGLAILPPPGQAARGNEGGTDEIAASLGRSGVGRRSGFPARRRASRRSLGVWDLGGGGLYRPPSEL